MAIVTAGRANSGLGVINSSMHGFDAPMTQGENYAFSTILVIALSSRRLHAPGPLPSLSQPRDDQAQIQLRQ